MKIHIKHVYVSGASFWPYYGGGYYARISLTMVEYSKGDKKVYYIGLDQSTKEECNSKYLELKHNCKHLKKDKKFEQKITEYDKTIEEIEKELMKDYDHYTDYIDDYDQERSAIKRNQAILDKIKVIKEL